MRDELAVSNKDLEHHLGGIGMGGQGRSTAVEAGNAAVAALKAALAKASVAEEQRGSIIGHFCNEWNAGIESGVIQF